MSTPTDRAAGLRALLSHLREATSVDVGFTLWDGSTIPADLAPDALSVVIADEGVIAALLRRPRFDTVIDLWVTKRFDLRNGTIIDLLDRYPKQRGRDMRHALNKGLALRMLARFLFVPAGGPWPLRALHGAVPPSDGSEAENAANVQYHYDMSNAFYALFLDPDMVYSCGYFRDWSNDIATAQRDKLDMTCRRLRLQPGDRFLDIGCGWGALVCHAAQHYGVKAHGVTLARQQYELAKERW
jgi:cyclopropane-fatty-acyl-phospholipid synthase